MISPTFIFTLGVTSYYHLDQHVYKRYWKFIHHQEHFLIEQFQLAKCVVYLLEPLPSLRPAMMLFPHDQCVVNHHLKKQMKLAVVAILAHHLDQSVIISFS